MSAVVLANDTVLVMGGYFDGYSFWDSKYRFYRYSGVLNDVWKTVDAGANWILVTSLASWAGNNIRTSSLCPLAHLHFSEPEGVESDL